MHGSPAVLKAARLQVTAAGFLPPPCCAASDVPDRRHIPRPIRRVAVAPLAVRGKLHQSLYCCRCCGDSLSIRRCLRQAGHFCSLNSTISASSASVLRLPNGDFTGFVHMGQRVRPGEQERITVRIASGAIRVVALIGRPGQLSRAGVDHQRASGVPRCGDSLSVFRSGRACRPPADRGRCRRASAGEAAPVGSLQRRPPGPRERRKMQRSPSAAARRPQKSD